MYVFYTSPLSALFKNYYRRRFPTLWERFDGMVEEGRIISTREMRRECVDGPVDTLREWAGEREEFFHTPSAAEGASVGQIYGVVHFQQNIEQRKLLRGGRMLTHLIAKAASEGRGGGYPGGVQGEWCPNSKTSASTLEWNVFH